MIFIVVKFKTKPDSAEQWMDLVGEFTAATRAEPGNLWFEWSRSVDDPTEYVLVEAFRDDAAAAHVTSDHFQKALQVLPTALAETPRIVNVAIEGATDWSTMSELSVG
jgi:quinol monooxygenase YgiN